MLKKIKKIINKISGYFYFKTLDLKENVSTHTNAKQVNLDLKGMENMLRSIEVLMDKNLPQGKCIIVQKDTFKNFDFPLRVDIEMINDAQQIPHPEPPKNGLSKETVENLKKFFEDGRNIGV